jgi:hypothetical protein
MRIMFGMKQEEIGVKLYIMCTLIIYAALQILGYQRTVATWVRNVAFSEGL